MQYKCHRFSYVKSILKHSSVKNLVKKTCWKIDRTRAIALVLIFRCVFLFCLPPTLTKFFTLSVFIFQTRNIYNSFMILCNGVWSVVRKCPGTPFWIQIHIFGREDDLTHGPSSSLSFVVDSGSVSSPLKSIMFTLHLQRWKWGQRSSPMKQSNDLQQNYGKYCQHHWQREHYSLQNGILKAFFSKRPFKALPRPNLNIRHLQRLSDVSA